MFICSSKHKKMIAEKVLESLKKNAEKNASIPCRGIMYEPKVPKSCLKRPKE